MEHGPIQNSNVVVMSGEARCCLPLSPPTPAESPPVSVCGHIEPLDLEDEEEPGLPTPPGQTEDALKTRVLDGVHVLRTQAEALARLAALFETHPESQYAFSEAVGAIVGASSPQRHTGGGRGKLVICGVGKSGHIGKKLVATFQSLGIPAAFLHPTEALHGDLGLVGAHDAFLFVTFSGKTPELLLLLPHLPASVRVIVLTARTEPGSCELLRRRPDGILLPAPVHVTEVESFGVAAPTTSTTVALAVGDALAVAVGRELHSDMSAVFARNHPGGSIGADLALRGSGP
jgi:D-arabinose 5-phosphate isomerase GutQ